MWGENGIQSPGKDFAISICAGDPHPRRDRQVGLHTTLLVGPGSHCYFDAHGKIGGIAVASVGQVVQGCFQISAFILEVFFMEKLSMHRYFLAVL